MPSFKVGKEGKKCDVPKMRFTLWLASLKLVMCFHSCYTPLNEAFSSPKFGNVFRLVGKSAGEKISGDGGQKHQISVRCRGRTFPRKAHFR